MFGANDLPMILGVAAVATVAATIAAHWVGRRMVRGLNRAKHAVRMAAWRRRYTRWAAEQPQPVASADLVSVIGKLIADGVR